MLQRKRARKAIAATFLAILLTNTLAPTVTYALTSGPTSPEATSFEPIDTTDMVNLQTGDFTYNIPLIEIPGPEGGYPISLSYHAGIQPNEDASWVGLGWTLNPGAINRSVSGYPDDWYDPSNSSHDFWEGGVRTTWNVGGSVGITGFASASFGLSFSQDTYLGFGIGSSTGINMGLNTSPFSMGGNMGISPYGEASFGASLGGGLGIASGKVFGFGGVSASTNFESLDVGANVGVGFKKDIMQVSLLGASISSRQKGISFNAGGISASVSGSKTAALRTSSSSVGIVIPLSPFFSFSLGYSKTRYWTDEKIGVATHGSLYSSGWPVNDNVAYDSYSLLEDPIDKNIIDYPDPTLLQGGAYPDFDLYSVSAQGLGGAMRPYLFQGEVMGQNRKNQSNAAITTFFSPGPTNFTPEFRFIGDFSNSYRQDYTNYSNPNLNLQAVIPPFDGSPTFGDNDGSAGFSSNQLAGSRHISAGVSVQPSNIKGYTKTDRYKASMIEGFSITNESGVTYHYALPVYTWGEEIYQQKIGAPGDLAFNRQNKGEAYAYTWLLTTITGPDYVERDPSGSANFGKASENDWGYWVNFEYGKWSNDYIWRNPSEGYNRDDDNQWQNCSMGVKEVYYLNAIRTRTHTALFEKDLRRDGKGASSDIFDKIDGKKYDNNGGFGSSSAQSLQLSKIYLVNNADGNYVTPTDGGLNPFPDIQTPSECNNCQLPLNVLDRTDVDDVGRVNVEAKSIRVLDFIYDYSLCPKTENSFISNSPIEKSGKLTLTTLNFRGKGGMSILPPTKFEYELGGSQIVSQNGVLLSATNFVTPNGQFNVGDMIKKDDGVYCGVISSKFPDPGGYKYYLVNSQFTGSLVTSNVSTTKNPPYNKDGYDMWGMNKSDINPALVESNENLARKTTYMSSKGVDAWSLRTITTSLGSQIKVNYESDDYFAPTLQTDYPIAANNISQVSGSANRIKIDLSGINNGFQPASIFALNGRLDFLLLLRSVDPLSVEGPFSCSWIDLKFVNDVYDSKNSSYPSLIKEIGLDYLIVENPDFASFWQSPIPVVNAIGQHITTTCLKNRLPNACNIKSIAVNNIPGGGIRVKSMQFIDNTSMEYSTIKYDYAKISDASSSSGVTSYEPSVLENVKMLNSNSNDIDGLKIYKSELYNDISNLLAISREIIHPGVMYENVTISNEVKNADEESSRAVEGKTQYQFEVFRENMILREKYNPLNGTYLSIPQTIWNWTVKKFTSSIGNIKKIVSYDVNGRKLTETINNYLHDGLESLSPTQFMSQYKSRLAQYKYQGYLQERYSEVKRVQNSDDLDGVRATLSAREEYPSIQTGQTIINYLNNTQTKSENIAFDFYSGAVTKVVETDAYGNRIMTETIPAYRKYSSMGLRITGNKNMLSQIAGSYTYKVDANNDELGVASAEVQTWSNVVPALDKDYASVLNNVWRMQALYDWMPVNKTADGLTTIGNFSDFNWTTPSASNANWKKTSEITLYDVYSKALEGTDINNMPSATRMTYASKKIALSGNNTKIYEMAFSGAEDEALNQTFNAIVKKGDGVVSTDAAHTGAKSLKLGVSGKKGFLYSALTNELTIGKDYFASVWVKPDSESTSDIKLFYDIDGVTKATSSSSASAKNANGWTLVTLKINGADIVAGKTLAIGCRNDHTSTEAYIDDMRFQPLNATTTAYVYDQFSGELTYILDNNNLYSKYEYDASGRLIKIYKEKLGVGVFKTNEYQYNTSQSTYTLPVTIYTKVTWEFQNTTYSGSSNCIKSDNYNAYIKFFSDPSCTIPLSVANLHLEYHKKVSTSDLGIIESVPYTLNIGATPINQYLIGSFPAFADYRCGIDGVYDSWTEIEIDYGEGYIIKPTDDPIRPVLYAKFKKTFVGTSSGGGGCLVQDLYNISVEFFRDYACTLPVSTNYVEIVYSYDNVLHIAPPSSALTHSVMLWTNVELHSENICEGISRTRECSLRYSPDYVIVP